MPAASVSSVANAATFTLFQRYHGTCVPLSAKT
jgi:hypothetical protein